MALSSRFLLLSALLVLSSLLAVRVAESKKVVSARTQDVPYIKCEVCEEVVKNLNRLVQRKRDEKSPKKLTELEIIEVAEKVCDVKKEGDWIQWLDIVEDGDRLTLKEQKSVGECKSDCKTIQKACQEVMGDHDTDAAEFLYRGEAKRAALSKLLCRTLSKACLKKPPPLPKTRGPGEEFVPKEAKEVERERLMRSMEGMPGGGRGMKMLHRDDIVEGGVPGLEGFGGGGGDDDDDDDEEEESGARTTPAAPAAGQVAGDEPQPTGEGSGEDAAFDAADMLKEGGQKVFDAAKGGAQQAYKAAAEGASAASEWLGRTGGEGAKEEPGPSGKGDEL